MTRESKELEAVARTSGVFEDDLRAAESDLRELVGAGSFLVIGGAGSIGQAVVRELFRRSPAVLHVIDSSENSLVELVRDLRSSLGYIEGDFRTFCIDASAPEFDALVGELGTYTHVLNLAAMKHVRNESDPFTLMRMLRTNVEMVQRTMALVESAGTKRYFSVSTDKAADAANAMGATKRAMELVLTRPQWSLCATSARFANVAFSDGSLLHGFRHRLMKRQPLSAPADIERYFITASEGATLCLLSALLGQPRECLIPADRAQLAPTGFRTIAERFLEANGFEAVPCDSEAEARRRVDELSTRGAWPCYFFSSDTTGEKTLEIFHTSEERIDRHRYREIDVVCWEALQDQGPLDRLLTTLPELRSGGSWNRRELLDLLQEAVPNFQHEDTGRFLDDRM